MIARQCGLQYGGHCQLSIARYRFFLRAAQRQYRPDRGIDNGSELVDVEHAQVGDCKGGASQVFPGQAAGPGAFGQCSRCPGYLLHGQVLGAGQGGGIEAVIGGDSDADIGTVFIGIATPDKVYAKKFTLGNHRDKVIGKAVNKSIELIREELFQQVKTHP